MTEPAIWFLFALWFYATLALAFVAVVYALAWLTPLFDWSGRERTAYSAVIGLAWPLWLAVVIWLGVRRA